MFILVIILPLPWVIWEKYLKERMVVSYGRSCTQMQGPPNKITPPPSPLRFGILSVPRILPQGVMPLSPLGKYILFSFVHRSFFFFFFGLKHWETVFNMWTLYLVARSALIYQWLEY